MTIKAILAAGGGIAAAAASALCCAGPLVAVAIGVSGAGLASTFEPLRPYLLAGTAVFLGTGFGLLRRDERRACEPGRPCADVAAHRRLKIALWIATAIALVFATFPTWSAWLS